MFLRPDGVLWDEEKDILPPRYNEYKAVLEKQDSSNVGAKPSQPSKPSEPLDKLPAKKLGEIYNQMREVNAMEVHLTYQEVVDKYFDGVQGSLSKDEKGYKEYRWEAQENSSQSIAVGFDNEFDKKEFYYNFDLTINNIING